MSFLLKAVKQYNVGTHTTAIRCISFTGLNSNFNIATHDKSSSQQYYKQQFRFKSENANNFNSKKNTKTNNAIYTLFTIGTISVGYLMFDNIDKIKKVQLKALETQDKKQQGEQESISDTDETYKLWHSTERKDLPTYSLDDVQKHNNFENGIWVTYGIGVYDITKFIPKHPGSDKIMLGAGSAIDPFWAIYQQHNNKEILSLLESYRIGNIRPEDEVATDDMGSPWAMEPKRHPLLKPASERPFNAEPPLSILADKFYTPNEFFYIRNHLPVPVIDINSYELEVEISTPKAAARDQIKTLTYEEIKSLPKHSVTAAIMCGGNRRSEMTKVKSVKGNKFLLIRK